MNVVVAAIKNLTSLPGSGSDIILNWFNPQELAGTCKTVILGSSTSAGAGASDAAHSYVGLLTAWLQSTFKNQSVINLAVSGYTSYALMPTGFTPPNGRPGVDPARNITAALALKPDIIIINIPTNDKTNGYADTEFINNLNTIYSLAKAAGVNIFITTTQPRNLALQQRKELQALAADIMHLYEQDAIDFFTGATNPDLTILTARDSGDGVHQNNTGHAAYFEAVKAKLQPLIQASIKVNGYQIEELALGTGWTVVGNVAKNVNTFTRTGLPGAVFRNYRIKSLGPELYSNLTNITSGAVIMQTLATPVLTLNSVSATQIDGIVTGVPHATAYITQRSTSNTFTNAVTITGTSFQDTGLAAGTLYYYRTKATAPGYQDSPWSATVIASPQLSGTPLPQLATPTLSVLPISAFRIDGTIGNVPNATAFETQRSTTPDFASPTILLEKSNTFQDASLISGTTYYYRTKATASGFTDSNWSAVAAATTQPANQRILIDIGNTNAGIPTTSPDFEGKYWNNTFLNNASVKSAPWLTTTVDIKNTLVEGLVITSNKNPGNAYNGSPEPVNFNGPNQQVGDYPASACMDSLFLWETAGTIEITITIPAGKTADIKFWGSRTGVPELRIGQMRIKGTTEWQEVSHRNNIVYNNAHYFNKLTGTVILEWQVKAGTGAFAYIGIIDILLY